MNRSLRFPSWVVSPEEFRTTLKTLLGLHYSTAETFDRSWTVRYVSENHRDLLVEVTHQLPSGSGLLPSPHLTDDPGESPPDGFEPLLRDLLAKAQDGGITLNRSWRFRYADTDRFDLLVEVTYLEKLTVTS